MSAFNPLNLFAAAAATNASFSNTRSAEVSDGSSLGPTIANVALAFHSPSVSDSSPTKESLSQGGNGNPPTQETISSLSVAGTVEVEDVDLDEDEDTEIEIEDEDEDETGTPTGTAPTTPSSTQKSKKRKARKVRRLFSRRSTRRLIVHELMDQVGGPLRKDDGKVYIRYKCKKCNKIITFKHKSGWTNTFSHAKACYGDYLEVCNCCCCLHHIILIIICFN